MKMNNFNKKEKGIKYKKIRLNGTKTLVSEYGQISDKNVILYIHGGSFKDERM